ncbi:hypothetical protein BHM03_00014369 [Ensete ventricosum]|nr:hypothetical protein BHM03_00014369 [Ensete ventricosum]
MGRVIPPAFIGRTAASRCSTVMVARGTAVHSASDGADAVFSARSKAVARTRDRRRRFCCDEGILPAIGCHAISFGVGVQSTEGEIGVRRITSSESTRKTSKLF